MDIGRLVELKNKEMVVILNDKDIVGQITDDMGLEFAQMVEERIDIQDVVVLREKLKAESDLGAFEAENEDYKSACNEISEILEDLRVLLKSARTDKIKSLRLIANIEEQINSVI
jgi:hypothetical protein